MIQFDPSLAVDVSPTSPSHLVVSGELDAATAPILRSALDRVAETETADITLDASGVTFIDSSALGALIGARKTLELQGRHLRLTSQSEFVRRLFELTGVTDKFA